MRKTGSSFLRSLRLRVKSDLKFLSKSINSRVLRFQTRTSYTVVSPFFDPKLISMKEKNKFHSVNLVEFEGEEDLVNWETETDYRRGGNSTCEMSLKGGDKETKFLHFSGSLRFEKELDFTGQLFAETTLKSLPRRKYRNFNGVRMQIQTDGNPYRLHLANYQYFNTELHYINIIDKTKQWTVLEAPFTNFVNAATAPEADVRMTSDSEMTQQILGLKLGIYSPKQRPGPFSLSLKSIDLIFRPDFEALQSRFSLPFMFKVQDNYEKAVYIDTGHSLIDLKTQGNTGKFKRSLSYPENEERK